MRDDRAHHEGDTRHYRDRDFAAGPVQKLLSKKVDGPVFRRVVDLNTLDDLRTCSRRLTGNGSGSHPERTSFFTCPRICVKIP